jgi:hypothetical protein
MDSVYQPQFQFSLLCDFRFPKNMLDEEFFSKEKLNGQIKILQVIHPITPKS